MSKKPFGNTEIEYPINMNLKVIFNNVDSIEVMKQRMKSVLDELNIPNSNYSAKSSSKATYISFSVGVTFTSKDELTLTYDALNRLKNVKYIL